MINIGGILILATIWCIAIGIAILLVKKNYDSGMSLLAVVSPGFRDYKLTKLCFSFPLYVIVYNLLFISLLPMKLTEKGWGFEYVLHDTFVIHPMYMLLCVTALLSSTFFSCFVLFLRKEWNSKTLNTFIAVSVAGMCLPAVFILTMSIAPSLR